MSSSQYYLSNPNLKAIGVAVEMTEHEVDEYTKCALDPIYFIKNYVKIISLDDGLVPFNLYDYQVKFIKTMEENRRVISMQPRQMGKSQTVAAYILWYSLFNKNKQAAILANKAAAAREIMSRYQMMYEYVPKFLQQGIKEWNKGSIELENGCKVFTAATTGSGLRGKSLNFLYMDETAIVPNNVFEDFFISTYPTISSGQTTKIVMTSTPLGYNHFWKFWTEAEEGINGFVPVKVHYNEHPKRDDKWAEEQLKILGELKYNQEVLCSFIGSSSTLVRGDVIAALATKKPIFDNTEGLLVYEKVNKDHTYITTVDTAKGVGGDSSTFTIFDVSVKPYRIVARYKNNKISPLLFPSVIHRWVKEYNNAWCLFEINSSEQVPTILFYDYEYENMILVARDKKNGQIVSAKRSAQLGLNMDKKVKRIGCQNLKTLIEEKHLDVCDVDTIQELSVFIETNGSYEADDGYHDDLVMTLVIFAWFSTTVFFQDLLDVNMRSRIYQQRMEEIESEELPVGLFVDGTETEVEVFNF